MFGNNESIWPAFHCGSDELKKKKPRKECLDKSFFFSIVLLNQSRHVDWLFLFNYIKK